MIRAMQLTAALAASTISLSAAAQVNFSTDFESATAITDDGWKYAVNYFDPTCSNYESTPYSNPAPNNGPQISALVSGNGSQKLNFYSNYDDIAQQTKCLEVNIFQEKTLTAADIGSYEFSFNTEDGANLGTSTNAGTVSAFVKLDFVPIAGTPIATLPAGSFSVDVEITAADVGKLLQFGFANTSSNYQDTGLYYDDVAFAPRIVTPPPGSTPGGGNGAGSAIGVPTLPFYALAVLSLLAGWMGQRKLRNRR